MQPPPFSVQLSPVFISAMYAKIIAVSTLVAAASAANVVIQVAKDGFVFTPNNVTAAVNDTVTFEFSGR